MEEPSSRSRNFLLGEGGSKRWLKKDCWTFFEANFFSATPPPPVAVARYTSLTSYHPVAVGAGNSASRAEANRSSKRYPKTITLLNIAGISPPLPFLELDTQEPPIRPDACLRRKFLHRPVLISIFNWLKKVCDKCLSIPISVSVRQTTYDDIFYL